MSDVVVTSQKMYDLLLAIDKRLEAALILQANHTDQLVDHEARIRVVESQEKLDTRLTELTKDVIDLTTQMRDLQKLVWRIPSISVFISLAAIGITFFRGVS